MKTILTTTFILSLSGSVLADEYAVFPGDDAHPLIEHSVGSQAQTGSIQEVALGPVFAGDDLNLAHSDAIDLDASNDSSTRIALESGKRYQSYFMIIPAAG